VGTVSTGGGFFEAPLNQTNTLITKDWRVWMIEFTRACRRAKTLQYLEEVGGVDRTLLLARLRAPDRNHMRQKLGCEWCRAEPTGSSSNRIGA
jgi:hypothetical protein